MDKREYGQMDRREQSLKMKMLLPSQKQMKTIRIAGIILFLFGVLLVTNLMPLEAISLDFMLNPPGGGFNFGVIYPVAVYPNDGMVLDTAPKTVWVIWAGPVFSSKAVLDGKTYGLKPVVGETGKWEGEIGYLPAGTHHLVFKAWDASGAVEFESQRITFETKTGGGFILSRQQLFGIACMGVGLFLFTRKEHE
jgi:hypothetical protein